ncbi:MAG: hypothetical protein M3460_29380 [Actinomycetota bacterium]|nr:hypothetical protein [Actinomycetota bacterium]
MPDDLTDHGVGEFPALLRVGARHDAVEQFKRLAVVGCQLVDDIGVGTLVSHVNLLDRVQDRS